MDEKEFKNPITVKEEEIDLGKLFSLIGNAFSNLFRFIGKLLKGIFHYLVLLLILIKEHFIKIFTAIILGVVIGSVIDYEIPDKYTYDMIIEPNYNSIHQIFEKMEYYNVLIDEQDTIALHNKFNISFEEAKSLVSFELEPYETKKDQILAYDEFIKDIDTATQRYFSFADFTKEKTSKFDSKRYVYRIISKINNLTLFRDKILSDIEKNPTLQEERRIKLSTLKLDSTRIWNALNEINSLRELNKKATLLEVEKSGITPNTYIDFSKESNKNNDIELFTIESRLNKRLVELEKEKETSSNIVTVITSFNPAGANRGTLTDSFKFFLGYLFGGIVLVFFLLKGLNQYLIDYKNKNLE